MVKGRNGSYFPICSGEKETSYHSATLEPAPEPQALGLKSKVSYWRPTSATCVELTVSLELKFLPRI